MVEPVRQCKLTFEELSQFLNTYTNVRCMNKSISSTSSKVVLEGTVSVDSGLRVSFQRFMVTVMVIVTTFHR